MQNQVTLTSFTAHNNDLNKEPKVSKILSSVFWNMAAWATLAPNFVHSEWNRGTPKLNFCQKCCQKGSIKFNFNISNVWCQIVLVPNCPVPNCPGAKLSWCQIVHFYYLGAKLSAFIILVPNCPLYYLGAKLSGAKLSGAKLSYNLSFPFIALESIASYIVLRLSAVFHWKSFEFCLFSSFSSDPDVNLKFVLPGRFKILHPSAYMQFFIWKPEN